MKFAGNYAKCLLQNSNFMLSIIHSFLSITFMHWDSLFEEGLEGDSLDRICVLTPSFVIMLLDEPLFELVLHHSCSLIRMYQQLVGFRSGQLFKTFPCSFHYRLSDCIGRFWVEQCNHVATITTKFGSCYKNLWWDLVRVELFGFWIFFAINRSRICPCTYHLPIFSDYCLSPVIQLN